MTIPHQAVMTRQVGRIARTLLEQNTAARVVGLTSRGVFLAVRNGWVIFVTSEPYRGPLTVNLETPIQGLELGDGIKIEQDGLAGVGRPLVRDWRDARTWEAPSIEPDQQPQPGWFQRLSDTSRMVAEGSGDLGLAGLLAPLLGLDGSASVGDSLLSSCVHLKETLQSEHWQAGLPDMDTFLGYGVGLTPSGDDFVLGLLLGLKRIPRLRDLGNFPLGTGASSMENFFDGVIQAARRRTTSLSASLIACAAQGQADERLVSALDGIYLGSLSPEECARLLLAWGSSSGGDSLAGMALAFILKCGI